MNVISGALFLLKYLYDHTDTDHPASSSQLRKLLQEQGFAADSRTIRKNIALLTEAGFDIIQNEQQGKPTEYFYDTRTWETSELRILIDAVSSAQFITPKKSKALIRKLAGMAGKQYLPELTPQVYVSEDVKAENDQILYILDAVSRGIRNKKKISFKMFNYDTGKKKIQRHNGEDYILSPYDTVWNTDRYYVTGYSDKREAVVSMRIDRMGTPKVLEEDAVEPPKDYRVQDYTSAITRMYGGGREKIVLRCRRALIDQIIDRFGRKVQLSNITEKTFDVTATVSVSGTFLGWLFQYAGEMTVLSPEPVREMYEKMLRAAQENLSQGDACVLEEQIWKL